MSGSGSDLNLGKQKQLTMWDPAQQNTSVLFGIIHLKASAFKSGRGVGKEDAGGITPDHVCFAAGCVCVRVCGHHEPGSELTHDATNTPDLKARTRTFNDKFDRACSACLVRQTVALTIERRKGASTVIVSGSSPKLHTIG